MYNNRIVYCPQKVVLSIILSETSRGKNKFSDQLFRDFSKKKLVTTCLCYSFLSLYSGHNLCVGNKPQDDTVYEQTAYSLLLLCAAH